MQSVEIHRASNAQDVAEQAATEILDRLSKAQGRYNLCLTGGTVGILTLKHLAEKPDLQNLNLQNVHFWFGDERFVAKDSPDRNANQARDALLSKLSISPNQIHEFPSLDETEDVATAAKLFENHLVGFFEGTKPRMDLTLLGMGPDGHVASLFPGHEYPEQLIVFEENSPKPPAQRISMSYALLNSSREIMFVVSGIDKAEAIESVHKNPACDLPAAKVCATEQTIWIVDEAAGAAFWSC